MLQQGQLSGITISDVAALRYLQSRIIPALITETVDPIPKPLLDISKDKKSALLRVTLDTIAPSISIGTKFATGVTTPLGDNCQLMIRRLFQHLLS